MLQVGFAPAVPLRVNWALPRSPLHLPRTAMPLPHAPSRSPSNGSRCVLRAGWLLATSWAVLVGSPAVLFADSLELERLEVSPAEVVLSGKNRQLQLQVTGIDGPLAFDVTRAVKIESADRDIVQVEHGFVTGRREGRTELLIGEGRLARRIPVTVSDFDNYPPVHFVNDIIPLFSKLGCNSGGCHGKQAGQNGFKLSVFGFDPRADHEALVKAARGRRVFPTAVERSLIYSKAIGKTAHGGGQRMRADSQDAELLLEWLKQGMPWGDDQAPVVTEIEVTPNLQSLVPRQQQQLRVVATYSDGRRRDVTRAAAYTSNQPAIAGCDPKGLVDAGQVAGEAAITINYMGLVDVARIVIPRPGDKPEKPRWLDDTHPIDRLTWKKWEQLRITPSAPCDDATFLRRVRLKVTGTLPTSQEVLAFEQDSAVDKRQRLVAQALQSDGYVHYWTQKWSDILMVNSRSLGGRGAYAFHQWIQRQVATNRPYDQWVREIILATGNSGQVGPANFYRSRRTPEDAAKTVSQAFLGVRLDCAQCHHHPFEKWGQDDFYGLAGYFNGMSREKLDENRELIYHPGHRSMSIPVIDRPVSTRPLAGEPTAVGPDVDPRPELAQWLTAAENPYFSRLVANRIWKHLMGRGLVEPEDDLRETNPPTNPELLDHLAQTLVESDFDLQHLMRHIMSSQTFQLSSVPNETNVDDQQTYSHYLVRRLPAAVMLDAICDVTGVPESYPGHPRGARAVQLWDNQLPSYFLDTFGRSLRESPCECGSSGEPTMAQALHLLNAPEIEAKLQHPHGRAAQLAASSRTEQELIREIVLSTANRAPTSEEIATARKFFAADTRLHAVQDFLWVMMNSYDFLFVK